MVFDSHQLITALKEYVNNHIQFAEKLKEVSEEKLQAKKDDTSWSILDCLEHLNLYAIFYNKEIAKRIEASNHIFSSSFKTGFLGNKFAVDMLPKKGMKTMNTFKSKNPIYSNLDKENVLNSFILYQQKLFELLTLAESKNLSKIKTSLTIPLLKFKLGDTFRFVIYHNERHIVQAKKLM